MTPPPEDFEKSIRDEMRITDEAWLELVQHEARKLDVFLPAAVAEMLLWEYTGWPAFWYTSEATEECRAQVRTTLRENLFAWQTQFPPPERAPVGPSVFRRLLER